MYYLLLHQLQGFLPNMYCNMSAKTQLSRSKVSTRHIAILMIATREIWIFRGNSKEMQNSPKYKTNQFHFNISHGSFSIHFSRHTQLFQPFTSSYSFLLVIKMFKLKIYDHCAEQNIQPEPACRICKTQVMLW